MGKRVSRVIKPMGHEISDSPLVFPLGRHPAPRFFSAAALSRWLLLLCAWSLNASGDDVSIEVAGVPEDMAANVRAHISGRWVTGDLLSSERRRAAYRESAVDRAAAALKPYGYYAPDIDGRLEPAGDGEWQLLLDIEPGPPVQVQSAEVAVMGSGDQLEAIRNWRDSWPLVAGSRLEQAVWEAKKAEALNIMEEEGFLTARFTAHSIELDLEHHAADLELVLDTGLRALMGEVRFQQDVVRESVIQPIPRFESGDRYRPSLVDRLRTDLWKTGYFEEIDVVEDRRLDQDPPVVDIAVTMSARRPNTHQGSIGWGTDTEFRTQYSWLRNRLSPRGDSLGVGLGWQSRYEELSVSGEYRLPREAGSRQYWLANALYSTEVQELELVSADGDTRVSLGNERINTFSLRGGRVRAIGLDWAEEPLDETMYAEYLYEHNAFDDLLQRPFLGVDPGVVDDARGSGFGQALQTLSLGVDYDWPVIRGSGFGTTGHHERAWLFTSNGAWGSDRDFTQVYLSSRWNVLLGERFKLLLRGEAGYTDARVREFEFGSPGEELAISVTELPFRYRFKAGGSRSVRGFGYEQLSDNGIGSNNIVTASVELEYQFRPAWSAAAFVDTGNAFNDWSDVDLKQGYGLGLRWYSIVGAVRLDVARGEGSFDDGWQIHLTIGTPLL